MVLGVPFLVLVLAMALPGAAAPGGQKANPRVALETSMGKIVIELYPDKAPKTVENFLKYVDDKFYDGTIFHRVIADFMIQGGCPEGSGRGGPGYRFEDETGNGVGHERGVLSMANAGPNTNGSQFFITLAPTLHLDNRHSVFGEVIKGQEVIVAIGNVSRDARDRPTKDVVLKEVVISRGSC